MNKWSPVNGGWIPLTNSNCGTGKGGFQEGNSCQLHKKGSQEEFEEISARLKAARKESDRLDGLADDAADRGDWAAMERFNKMVDDLGVDDIFKEYVLHPMNKDKQYDSLKKGLAKGKEQEQKDKSIKRLNPASKVKGTEYTVGDLLNAAQQSGKNLYGSGLIYDIAGITKVEYRSLSAKSATGNIDYIFFPSSPGKGLNTPPNGKLHKNMADIDGNIYVYSATDSEGGLPRVKIYRAKK